MKNLILRAMPDCHEAAGVSWRLVHDKPMEWRERLALGAHLVACPCCRSHHKHLKWLREGVVSNLTASRVNAGK